MTTQIDLNDRLFSLRRHIFNLYPLGNIHVAFEREQNLIRPSWTIQHINTSHPTQTHLLYCEEDTWKLWYYGTSRENVYKTISGFMASINEPVFDPTTGAQTNYRSMLRINAYRFGWQFPTPYPYLDSTYTLQGNLLQQGQYLVRVSGIDLNGNESAASAPLTFNIPSNGIYYFQVRIPRVPWSMPLFSKYKIYVNGMLQTTVKQPNDVYATFTCTSLVNSNSAPIEPSDKVAVRWKYLKVKKVSSRIFEDEILDGTFTGVVNLETEVQQERTQQQVDVMRKIQVSGVDTPYIITPLSHL